MPRSSPSPQQQTLDATAMPVDSQQSLLIWRGIFYQQLGCEPAAIGVFDIEDFVGEWNVEPTHEEAKAIITERLDPRHPEHNILMDAMREADEQRIRDCYEAYLGDLAEERGL